MTGKLEAMRTVMRGTDAAFTPYAPYGEPIEGLSWAKIDFDEEAGSGTYFLRFDPGAASRPHRHSHAEQFMVLDGELVDSDGEVFRAGDHVHYDAGSEHYSHAPDGCVLLVVLKGWNRPKAEAAQ